MSDRRAVSAGYLGASSVAAAHETWRVAVGGNRVENMTVDQIAQAFQSGHLNVRTPLWPPGTTGWQALGNFEQFQQAASYGGGLSQFEESDDDPTRMWTGGSEMDLAGMEAAMGVGQQPQAPDPRPNARTGIRQVVPAASRPAASQHQMPQQQMPTQQQMMSVPAPRPAPTASLPPSRSPSIAPASIPPFRKGRGNGLMLVAGLVGLVGLGSAVLAARGSWSHSEPAANASVTPTAEAPAPVLADPAPAERTAVEEPKAAEAEAAKPAPSAEQGEARLAKYEDTSAFVAGEAKSAPSPEASASTSEGTAKASADKSSAEARVSSKSHADGASSGSKEQDDDTERAPSHSEKKAASKLKAEEAAARKAAARETPKRASSVAAAKAKAVSVPAPHVEKAEPAAEKVAKVEKAPKAEKAEAAEAPPAPASSAVNDAAAAALANSSNLASSCRPPGGPSGQGKARVIYSNDGEVQSVEILTAKFRDTLTGSCVRMVFRRAKIAPFKGEPPTFIKSFTIPET